MSAFQSGPKRGRKCYITLLGSPQIKAGPKDWAQMLHHPCLCSGIPKQCRGDKSISALFWARFALSPFAFGDPQRIAGVIIAAPTFWAQKARLGQLLILSPALFGDPRECKGNLM